MKTYTFFILSRSLTISVPANNSYDAKMVVAHQFNIQNKSLILQLGINLGDRHDSVKISVN